jgi:hypothetical protein
MPPINYVITDASASRARPTWESIFASAQAEAAPILANPGAYTAAQAEEALSTSTIAPWLTYLVRRRIEPALLLEPSPNWRTLARIEPAMDFRDEKIFRLGPGGGLVKLLPDDEVKDSTLKETEVATVNLATWARAMSMTRHDWVNNDIGIVNFIGDEMARQVNITKAGRVIVSIIAANSVLADGRAMANVTDGNLGSTALTPTIAGANALVAAYNAAKALMKSDDGLNPGGTAYTIGSPAYLLIPWQLAGIARNLLTLPTVDYGAGVPGPNPAYGYVDLRIMVEPMLTNSNNWYIVPDVNDPRVNFIIARFLYGNEAPTFLRYDNATQGFNGGPDWMFSFERHSIRWQVFIDYDAFPVGRMGFFASIVAGA